MKKKNNNIDPFSSLTEVKNLKLLKQIFDENPLGEDLFNAIPLFLKRQTLMKIFYFKDLYEKILDKEGNIFIFGCRYGSDLSILTSLRGILEPYNHNRKIFAFDTFEGLKGTSSKDTKRAIVGDGSYSTKPGFEKVLDKVINLQESFSPISHIKKFQIVKGDIRKTLKPFLKSKPETIASLIILDMDIYAPTKFALQNIKSCTHKGTILAFDESNWEAFPGPTIAFKEVFGLKNYIIRKSNYAPVPSFVQLV